VLKNTLDNEVLFEFIAEYEKSKSGPISNLTQQKNSSAPVSNLNQKKYNFQSLVDIPENIPPTFMTILDYKNALNSPNLLEIMKDKTADEKLWIEILKENLPKNYNNLDDAEKISAIEKIIQEPAYFYREVLKITMTKEINKLSIDEKKKLYELFKNKTYLDKLLFNKVMEELNKSQYLSTYKMAYSKSYNNNEMKEKGKIIQMNILRNILHPSFFYWVLLDNNKNINNLYEKSKSKLRTYMKINTKLYEELKILEKPTTINKIKKYVTDYANRNN
jgi:hypothetical protein